MQICKQEIVYHALKMQRFQNLSERVRMNGVLYHVNAYSQACLSHSQTYKDYLIRNLLAATNCR